MKKTILYGLLIVVLWIPAFAQEIKTQAPFTYAYLECSGPYSQIPAKIGEFMQLFFGQKLTPLGALMGVYFNSPEQCKDESELKWGIGMPVAAEANVALPLKKGEYGAKKCVVYIHVGPFEKVADSYGKVMEFIGKSKLKVAGPVMEKYLDNPQMVKPENLRTEIVVPVEPSTEPEPGR